MWLSELIWFLAALEWMEGLNSYDLGNGVWILLGLTCAVSLVPVDGPAVVGMLWDGVDGVVNSKICIQQKQSKYPVCFIASPRFHFPIAEKFGWSECFLQRDAKFGFKRAGFG